MSNVENLKRIRSTAKARLTKYGNNLRKYINDKNSLEIVDALYSDFVCAWKNLEDKHDAYVSICDDNESSANEEWFDDVQKCFNDIRLMYMEYKKTVEVQTQILQALQFRDICDVDSNELFDDLERSVTHKFQNETVLRERDYLLKMFDDIESSRKQLCLIKGQDDNKSLFMWYAKIFNKFERVNKTVDDYVRSGRSEKGMEKGTAMRMTKIPLPTFDGNIRSYTRFIKDFKDMVLPNVKPTEAPFTLRQCLSNRIRAELSFCDDDVTDILSRLDEKYANPGKFVDCIITEIQQCRKLDDDDSKKFISFIDIIDRGCRDLKKLNLEQEVCNSHVLAIIEGKLPRDIQIEWYRMIHKQKIDMKDIERAALEYGMSELRSNSERKYGGVHNIEKVGEKETCFIHANSNHKISECRSYLGMRISERYDLLKNNSASFCCLMPNHRSGQCIRGKECGDGCKKYHHRSLHSDEYDGSTHTLIGDWPNEHEETVILPIMKVRTHGDDNINISWDTAANLSLITKNKAKSMNLNGKPVKLSVILAGGEKKVIESERYFVPIVNLNGQVKHVSAFGIERITNSISEIDTECIMNIFPGVPFGRIARPCGEVELLVGYDYAGWHPTKELCHKHLLLLSNQFGKCFGGNHPRLKESTQKYVNNVSVVNFVYKNGMSSDFFSMESMGVSCVPKCGNCMCRKCPIGGKSFTLKRRGNCTKSKAGYLFIQTVG